MSAPTPLRLRPLEVGDLLDETFRMYRRHFFLFAGLSVLLSIPSAGLSGFFSYALLNGLIQETNALQGPNFNLSFLGPTLVAAVVVLLITLVLLPFFYGAVTFAACESALGRPVTAAGILSGVMRRYFHLLGYWLLIGLMVIVFCLLPLWVWIWVSWVAVMPIMFVENVGLGAAMSRSWRLVEGRWWRTFLIVFLIFIITYAVRIALGAFIALGQGLLQLVVSPLIVVWISGATSVIVDSLVNPVLQIAVVLIYFDLRVRREALDLFQLAQGLPSPPALPGMASTS
ncbi:MAG TPA: hypothetical protein VNY77_03945 [Candidatus Angelobacter sp.]|nr:hypothetical protein [Candidatus Angelobacter sp.]